MAWRQLMSRNAAGIGFPAGSAVRQVGASCLMAGSALLSPAVPALAQQGSTSQPAPAPDDSLQLEEVEVTAPRQNLLGTATTASQGVINNEEIQLAPAYRPGQILETIPGLTVTSHSGEGKANQYLLRGYNLDHGTDLETYVDAMPINQPTHAHGQGYTDLSFMIPSSRIRLPIPRGHTTPMLAISAPSARTGSAIGTPLRIRRPRLSVRMAMSGYWGRERCRSAMGICSKP